MAGVSCLYDNFRYMSVFRSTCSLLLHDGFRKIRNTLFHKYIFHHTFSRSIYIHRQIHCRISFYIQDPELTFGKHGVCVTSHL